jgi:acetoin utilization deacetylase AcuC-like enzyme
MSDKEIYQMIIGKIEDLKSGIEKSLDRHEEKIDKQTEKLNSFEIRAESVLAVHDSDIISLKNRMEKMEAENIKKQSPISSFINSDTVTLIFRGLITTLLTTILAIMTAMGTVKTDTASKVFHALVPKTTISDTIKK